MFPGSWQAAHCTYPKERVVSRHSKFSFIRAYTEESMSLETKPENREYFRRHVPVYASATYWRDDEDVLTRRYFTDSHASLLVLGCGGGRVLPPLVKRGFKITAIDIEPEMVAAAKTKCGDNGIQFSTQDAAHLDFSAR